MIELKNISFRYQSKKNSDFLLQDFNLTIDDGEFLSVVGPSGCGKTTLAHILAGYQQPDAGEVLINQSPVIKPNKSRVVISQENDIFEWMTVWENLRIVTSDEVTIRRCLALAHLEHVASYYPRQLSGGMKKRLSVVRALAVNSDFIIMDEPFGSLDMQIKDVLQEEVLRIVHETKKTILLVTHDLEEAVFLSSRIIVLSGRPLRIQAEIRIPFDNPRVISLKDTAAFNQLKHVVREELNASSPSLDKEQFLA